FSTDMIPICLLSVEAKESMAGLYKILDDGVANPLARIDGVGTVSISGAPKREIHVYCDPNKLEAYHMTVEGIAGIITAENRNIPGGAFDIGSNTFSLRVQGEFDETSEMLNIPVGTYNGSIIYLKDVATVDDSLEERTQHSYIGGKEGAIIVIQKQSGANSVQISEQVIKMLPKLQKNLPSDIKLGVIVDTSDNIRNTIASLEETVLYALLFVMLVVFFFLGRWRATMIIVITIPVSLIASFIYLYATGNTLNIVSLSALSISIGMVVDDAIVVLENVTTHIERGSDPKQAAVHGTNEVAISVIASTLTLIAVFFPLTLVTGMTGVLFRQLGWMVCIMMVISTTCALSLTPMLCSQWLRRVQHHGALFTKLYGPIERSLDRFDNWYAGVLRTVVSHRTVTVIVCLGIFAGSIFLMKFVGTEFFPTQDNGRLGVNLELPIGSRVERAYDATSRLDSLWRAKYPEIKVSSFTVGPASADNTFASLSDNGAHIVSMNINLYDKVDRKRGIKEIADGMRQDIKEQFPEFVKAQVNVGGGRGSGMGGQSIVDFEIYGYDFTATDSVARMLKQALAGIKGTADIMISRGDYQPEYQVDFDREKLSLYGLNLASVAQMLRNRVNGATASQFREDGEEYDIKVMFDKKHRTTLEDLENIVVATPTGGQVRIKELGKVVERFTPPTIERKDRERLVTVSTVVDGVPMSQVVEQAEILIDQMHLPAGISIQLAGSYEDQQDSFSDLLLLGILIVILVYIVMAAQFESFTYPGIIMTSLLFAFSGVFLILWMTGHTLNVMSMIGAIMLIGIVVKNGIVLIDYIILNRERGMSIRRAVIDAGRSRLRPVVMTTATTILGMVPMAVGSGQGAEMWQPMGTAVIGGLTFSTILTLLFVPVLYCSFAGRGVLNIRKSLRKQHNA
ncbi:MAG: efflux RND transporter permease subunit, partial [Muribaculaceae bacterium]|nr:efflux RND transporter permease subunit [Muribaculaceae bacterium]